MVIVATYGSTFDMLPTVLNLTQLEFGIRKVVKRVLGLSAVIFPQSSDIEDTDKDRIGDAFGILCFHKKRTKEQMLRILEKVDSQGELNRYFVWALWSQCDEADWILANLPEELRGRVSARYLAGDLGNQPAVFILALMDGFIDVGKGDSEILAEAQSAFENPNFDEVQIQILEKNKQRGARIIQYLKLCGYKIEKMGVSESGIGFCVYRQIRVSKTPSHYFYIRYVFDSSKYLT
jgi:hypothetical protein